MNFIRKLPLLLLLGTALGAWDHAQGQAMPKSPTLPNYQFTYTTNNGGITITGVTGNDAGLNLTIPSTINGLPVTVLASNALAGGNFNIVSVPDSVTNIEDSAFSGCTNLGMITLGAGVVNLGQKAFYNCSKLASITLPDSLTSIADSTFFNCHNLTQVTLGSQVTSIGDSAFVLSGLTSLSVPASVTSIGWRAFYNCAGLLTVFFAGNAPAMGMDVFYGDNQLSVSFLAGTTGWSATAALQNVPLSEYPLIVALGSLTFDPQTGLFYQPMTVSNSSSSTLSGLRFTVLNLAGLAANNNTVYLVSATGTNASGLPYVNYAGSLPANSSTPFTLAYYSTSRQAPIGVNVLVETVSITAPTNYSGSLVSVQPPFARPDGKMAFEFKTVAAQTYAIQYSSDLITWKQAQGLVTGTGTALIWVDAGPPDTEASTGSRYYRVVQVP